MGDNENLRNSDPNDACVTERDMMLSALDTLVGGLIILDSQLRIVATNKLAVTLLDVPPDLVRRARPFLILCALPPIGVITARVPPTSSTTALCPSLRSASRTS